MEHAGKLIAQTIGMRKIAIENGLKASMALRQRHFDYVDKFDMFHWLDRTPTCPLWRASAATGLTPNEHVGFAPNTTHPLQNKYCVDLDENFLNAVEFNAAVKLSASIMFVKK